MRPARKGPENGRGRGRRGARPACFNEAGPQGAGKPLRRDLVIPAIVLLQ